MKSPSNSEDMPAVPIARSKKANLRQRLSSPATIVGLAAFVQAFDVSAVSIALPDIARDFGEDPLALDSVIIAYLVSATAVLPVCGWAVERFGARKMFISAIALFGIAALVCGLATNLEMLLAARVVEGCAGAMMLPVGRVIVFSSVPADRFVSAMATMTLPVLLGPVIGPPLGGLLVTNGSWRWMFFVMAPVTMAAIVLVVLFIKPVKPSHRERLDIGGTLLLMGALVTISTGVGALGGASPSFGKAIPLILFGITMALGYRAHWKRNRRAVLDLAPLSNQFVRVSNIGGIFVRMLVSSTPFLLAILFQVRFGLNAAEAGGLIFAIAVGSIVGRSLMPAVAKRLGFRTLMLGGTLALSLSVAACAVFDGTTSPAIIMAILFVQGAIRSAQLIAFALIGFSGLPKSQLPAASTISSISQQFSQNLGIAISVFSVQILSFAQGADANGGSAIATAFPMLAALSLIALFWVAKLPPDAGDEMSGRVRANR